MSTTAAGRHPDWPQRLQAVLHAAARRPFRWGEHDCCTFSATCVHAVTGVDPMAGWAVRYHSQHGAARAMKFGGGLAVLCDERLGPRVHASQAQPGDVGMYRNGDTVALAVHTGSCWQAPRTEGLAVIRDDLVLQAWRCCRG